MNEILKNLYVQLGYNGALPETIPTPSEAAIDSVSAASLVDPPVLEFGSTAGVPADVVTTVDPAEVPPLSPEGIDQLEMELNENPEATVARARQVLDEEITESELRSRIRQARMALNSPATAVDFLAAESLHPIAVIDKIFKKASFDDLSARSRHARDACACGSTSPSSIRVTCCLT